MPELELYQVMQTTRAVRRLRSDPIPDEVLLRVLRAATWAPSGGNRQPWRVIAVRDAARKQHLQALYEADWRPYAAHSRKGAAALPEAAAKRAERSLAAGDYLAAHLGEVPAILVFCFDPRGVLATDTKLGRLSIVGGASIYPAVQNTLLACRAEGLGCVLTTLLCSHEPELRAFLELPEPWGLAAFVPIGYPLGAGHGPLSRRPVEEMVYLDRWGTPLSAAK
jgi:nitroreductase